MTEQGEETHTLMSPAKVNGKWRSAGTVVTVDPTIAGHLRTAGAIGSDRVSPASPEDTDALRHRVALLEVELAEVYDALAEEKSTAAARFMELQAERDAANRAAEEANAKASAISVQADADHKAAVARIAELEQSVADGQRQALAPAPGTSAANEEQKPKPEKSKK